MRKVRIGAGVLVVAAAACGRSAPSDVDAGLRQDLEAAQTTVAGGGERTQFVSAVELGRAADAPRAKAGRGTPTPRAAARSTARARVVTPVRRVAAVAPRTPAPAEAVAEVPAPPAERPTVDEAPAPDEPVVAAPSRRPAPAPAPGRGRGRVWDMGDVIRNAPFPINPARAGL